MSKTIPFAGAVTLAVVFSVVTVRAQEAPAPVPESQAPATTGASKANSAEAEKSHQARQEARIEALEKQVRELTAAAASTSSRPSVGPATQAEPSGPATAPPHPAMAPQLKAEPFPVSISGYIQGQYEVHQDSQDQVRQGGVLLNQDRAVLRRARLKVEREFEYAHFMLELDGNTVSGPSIVVHHAEASVQYRGDNASSMPPLVQVTFGKFDVPYGYELLESPRTRFFMERSQASRALFPSEPDIGMRFSGALGWFRYSAAVVNGEPIGVKDTFASQSPTGSKDVVGRVGGVIEPSDSAEISFGASVINGKGFYRGSDATKNTLVWKDGNEDGTIQPGLELVGVTATAATPSRTFTRWAVGGDAQVRFRTNLGWTQIYGELELANNYDRGLYVANPITSGFDTRELGWYVGLLQEVTKYGMVGFRADLYDPNSDILDRYGGKLIPSNQTVRTFSPLVGLVLPQRARLVFQYDFIRDHFAIDQNGFPRDLKNDAWTLRLQVQL